MTYQEVFEWIDDNYDLDDYGSTEEMYDAIQADWTGRNDFASIISLEDFNNTYYKEEEEDVNEFEFNGGSQGTGDSPSDIEDTARSPEQNLSSRQKISSGVKRWLGR